MDMRFSFSIPLKSIREYARKVIKVAPLPEYIARRGPYIHDTMKIVVVYEFDKVRFAEAQKIVAKHIKAFQGIPGFALHSYTTSTPLNPFERKEPHDTGRRDRIRLLGPEHRQELQRPGRV